MPILAAQPLPVCQSSRSLGLVPSLKPRRHLDNTPLQPQPLTVLRRDVQRLICSRIAQRMAAAKRMFDGNATVPQAAARSRARQGTAPQGTASQDTARWCRAKSATRAPDDASDAGLTDTTLSRCDRHHMQRPVVFAMQSLLGPCASCPDAYKPQQMRELHSTQHRSVLLFVPRRNIR